LGGHRLGYLDPGAGAGQSGQYPIERAHNIPLPFLMKYCLKGVGFQEGTFIIDRKLREKVQFHHIN
jgi:chemotaxis protein methyltransferase CheR